MDPLPFMPDETSDQMDDSELVSLLGQHEAQAIGYAPGGGDEISDQQARALNYYYRVMDDVPSQEGSSSVTDGTVAVVIDNALAALLKPFVSSDETVMFSPRGPEDIDAAEQATEYVNYIFNVDNPGFCIIHDWFKDALLTKLGVVKVWWEAENREETKDIQIIDEVHAQMLRQHKDYRGEDGETAQLGQTIEDGRVKVVNIPPEEFRISPLSRTIDTAIYCAHVPMNVTRSDLLEMGFDAEIIESLPATAYDVTGAGLRTARYEDENSNTRVDTSHKPQDRMAVRDEYARIDYDGDGVAELRRVIRVGDVVLLNEEAPEAPFAGLCPIPMPHKVYGLSLADLVIDLQKINTVLWRQMLDNLYKSNNPRPVVGQNAMLSDGSTGDSLMDNAPGSAIMLNDINSFRFDAVPFTADKSYPMLELVGNMVEERTGVSRAGQGLDSNTLRKAGQVTATEMAMIASGKNARIEMIARIFAETGVKRLFKLILGLVSEHQPRERLIRLRNKWVPMDPRGWPEMDLAVSVGLGVGEKGEMIAQADAVLETMAELAQSPFADLIDKKHVYNAVKRKFTAAGIKNVDEYISSPEDEMDEEGNPKPKPEKPDPEAMKLQAEMQMQQAKLEGEQQLAAAKLQGDQAAMAAKLDGAREEAALKQQLAREQAEFEAGLAVEKMNREAGLEERRMAMEARRHEHAEAMAERTTEAKLSQNREGGALDK